MFRKNWFGMMTYFSFLGELFPLSSQQLVVKWAHAVSIVILDQATRPRAIDRFSSSTWGSN